jgi:hypothetical protein
VHISWIKRCKSVSNRGSACLGYKSHLAHQIKSSFKKSSNQKPAQYLSWEPNGSPYTNSYHHPQASAFSSLVGSLVRGMLSFGSHTLPVSPLGLALSAHQRYCCMRSALISWLDAKKDRVESVLGDSFGGVARVSPILLLQSSLHQLVLEGRHFSFIAGDHRVETSLKRLLAHVLKNRSGSQKANCRVFVGGLPFSNHACICENNTFGGHLF